MIGDHWPLLDALQEESVQQREIMKKTLALVNMTNLSNDEEKLTPKEKFLKWAVSFACLDPRVRIYRFFQGIAQHGETELKFHRAGQLISRQGGERNLRQKQMMVDAFDVSKIFTVWRPCSNESIRLMMLGLGVGKGLDIKGKSAKLGKCSGYVPFMQIHSESDKLKIARLCPRSRLKIFYESKETRDEAMKIAEDVLKEMEGILKEMDSTVRNLNSRVEKLTDGAKADIDSSNRSDSTDQSRFQTLDNSINSRFPEEDVVGYCEACEQKQKWHMVGDRSVKAVDDHASGGSGVYPSGVSGVFGMELPETLFWEAFVIREKEHCERWKLLEHGDCECHIKSTGFAEKIMHQMILVSDQQVDRPGFIWIYEANPEEKNPTTLAGSREKSSWAFEIVDEDRFVEKVLIPIREHDSTFSIKYSSFLGELRRSGFEQQPAVLEKKYRYRHPFFQKDRPELCALIGSEHFTGRKSCPASQYANLKSLRIKSKDGPEYGPKVVLFSMKDDENPHCPHNLLVAYEEKDRVVPVVSDFDGFTIGTKRIKFEEPMPPEQVETMKETVRTARDVVTGNTEGKFWAEKWNYAKRNRFAREKKGTPKPFGYGDPTTCKLVEAVVRKMTNFYKNGAVRHSFESFNFENPQELDENFLVISDKISETIKNTNRKKVPWETVEQSKLLDFLKGRIEEGFTFPCNPKWILCDSGWDTIYEELIKSKNTTTKLSMETWLPQSSGLRKMIDNIKEAHPMGLSFRSKHISVRDDVSIETNVDIVASYHLDSLSKHRVQLRIGKGSVVQFTRHGLRAGIVCASNESCLPVCGGVLQAVVQAGGKQLLDEAKALPVLTKTIFGEVRCKTGDAKMAVRDDNNYYDQLNVGHVIFAVGPTYGDADLDIALRIKDDLLQSAYTASLERANEQQLEAIGFSLLSAGKRSIATDPQRALRIAMKTLHSYRDFGCLREIHLCAFTDKEADDLMSIAKEYGMQEVTPSTSTATPNGTPIPLIPSSVNNCSPGRATATPSPMATEATPPL